MSIVIVPQEKDQILAKLAHSQLSVFTHMRVCVCAWICMTWFLLVRLLPVTERKIKDSPHGVGAWKRKRTAAVSEVCCCSVPVCLCGKCESVFFGGISGNGARWRERQTPCGLENMSGPEPTWAKIEDTAPLCCSFSICLPVFSFVCLFQSIISGQSTSLFSSVTLSFLFAALFFFFSPFPLFAVSLPHQYLITLILFVKRMHTLCLSIHASHLFFSISSVSFINVFSKIHMKVNKMSEMSCYKQFNQESEVRKWIDRFIFSLWAVLVRHSSGLNVSVAIAQCQPLNGLGALCQHCTGIRSGICSPIVVRCCS